jgi:hypothetical protein
MRIETDRLKDRFTTMLQRPDPPDLRGVISPDVRRGYRYTQLGKPNRRAEVGIPLLIRWYQTRILIREEGESR